MMPREKWTDERLDDLNAKVDKGFAETKAEIREGFGRVDAEIRDLRTEMNARFEKVDERFEKLDGRFDSFYKVLVIAAAVVIAALISLGAT